MTLLSGFRDWIAVDKGRGDSFNDSGLALKIFSLPVESIFPGDN